MAHNLNFNSKTGTYSFASAIQPAWHDLGQILPGLMTAQEAIDAANLNFDVEKRELITRVPTDPTNPVPGLDEIEVPNFYATVRMDTNQVLGVVGSKYEVVQNHDCFSFFDSIVESGAAIYETAGALGNGEKIFITAKLPNNLVIGDDVIEQYLFLTSSHDGSGAITAAFTPTRIVCANTLRVALSNKMREVNIRHTRNANIELRQAAELMGIVTRKSEETGRNFRRLVKCKIDDKVMLELLKDVFKPVDTVADDASKWVSKRAEEVMEYHHTHDTQNTRECKGTLYGMVNAVTGFYQNGFDFKTPEKKLTSILDGRASTYSTRAFTMALDYMANN